MIDLLFLITRFATDTGVRGTISEEIIKSGEELSLASGSQLSIYLTSEELKVINYKYVIPQILEHLPSRRKIHLINCPVSDREPCFNSFRVMIGIAW